MQLVIRHETVYRYTAPLSHTIQLLHLWPRAEPQQRVLDWNIASAGRRHEFIDAFGNACQMLTITGLHDEVRIVAAGSVATAALDRGRLPLQDRLSPLVFAAPTRLTEATDEVREFAVRHLAPKPCTRDLLALAEAIRGTVVYGSGATEASSPAAHALQARMGVCQDHAHLFLACCRLHGVPARYVSGYIDPGDTAHAASHAWVDAWVEEPDFAGWVSIDVTHSCLVGVAHCRLAVGRDYESAAPVRGVRQGGGRESMDVTVDVRAAD